MATQQRQHGLISDEYGFLVGSRRLEQGIESVDDKVQRIIEFLEKNAKPTKVVNSQTVAQNQVAKDVSKLVALTEKSHKEIQKTKVANSQTLRNGGNIKNRQENENSSLSTRPTKVVNSQTGAINASESVGSFATELSTDQPTRTVNSQTSQQAQNRQRDANGRFIGGEGEQSKSSGGLFKGMTQAVRNGFLQANSDGQHLDPSIDALYEVKNVLSPVGRFAGLMLRPLGALFKSRKRNEPLSREEEKHNKKEIKLLERIARMGGGGGGGGLLGGLLRMVGGGLLRMVALPILALAGAFFGGFKIGQIINEKVGGWINTLIEADIPKKISEAWNGFITKLSELIPDVLKKAFEATPFGAAQKGGSKLLEWGRGVANTVKSTVSEAYNDTVGDSGQSSGANTNKPNNGGLQGTSVGEKTMALIRKHEGFSKKAYWDVNAYRTGYGSDTITDKHGNIKKVTKSSTVSKEDAERDLVRRSQIFANEARKQVGAEHWDKLPPDAQAALTSVAYNYGSLPKKVAKSVKTGNLNQISESVRELQVHNNGINKGRRNNEADIIKSATFAKTEPPAKQPVTQSSAQPTITPKATARSTTTTKIETPKGAAALAKFAQNAEVPTATPVATPQKTGTPKSTALPPTISKPPVVPSLSLKPAINMKAQPIQFRSAAKVEAIPKIETVPEMHTSPKPMLVQSVNSGDNISQNLSDRGLAHLVTGGLGENRYGA